MTAERKTDAMAPLPTHVIHAGYGKPIFVEFRPRGDQSHGRTGIYYNHEDEMERAGHPALWSADRGGTLKSGQPVSVYIETIAQYQTAQTRKVLP